MRSQTAACYALACRVNHACQPNVHATWSESLGMLTMHAVQQIACGAEITVSYINPGMTLAERSSLIRRNFDFTCSCALCTLTGAEVDASDRRQRRVSEIDALLQHEGSSPPAAARASQGAYALARERRLASGVVPKRDGSGLHAVLQEQQLRPCSPVDEACHQGRQDAAWRRLEGRA